jgi:hypothetical protein
MGLIFNRLYGIIFQKKALFLNNNPIKETYSETALE